MGDGKALQMGTSHELGQNFAKPFDITYANATGGTEYVWQTSWGVSTRLVGALVMGHGDDFGLRLPPALAPTQVVVLVVKDDPEVGGGGRGAGRRSSRRPGTGSASTPAPTPASAGAAWPGSSRASRCGWRSARGTWPRGT